MTEYVRSMTFTLTVDTNKQTYTFEGDTWDALRAAWNEAADNGLTPPPLVDAPPLPEIREEDVRELRLCIASAKGSAEGAFGAGTIPSTVLLDYLAATRILAVLEAVSARKGGGK